MTRNKKKSNTTMTKKDCACVRIPFSKMSDGLRDYLVKESKSRCIASGAVFLALVKWSIESL
jgi:hypothetical protein